VVVARWRHGKEKPTTRTLRKTGLPCVQGLESGRSQRRSVGLVVGDWACHLGGSIARRCCGQGHFSSSQRRRPMQAESGGKPIRFCSEWPQLESYSRSTGTGVREPDVRISRINCALTTGSTDGGACLPMSL
jgi:hypothetical protein